MLEKSKKSEEVSKTVLHLMKPHSSSHPPVRWRDRHGQRQQQRHCSNVLPPENSPSHPSNQRPSVSPETANSGDKRVSPRRRLPPPKLRRMAEGAHASPQRMSAHISSDVSLQPGSGTEALTWLASFPLGRRAPCDIYWHGVSFHDNEHIVSGQVNKFPGMVEMLRKINLSKAMRTMQQLFPEEYDFYPRSWILPEEYQQFSAQIRLGKENEISGTPTFIVKPDGGSQGCGIYLIRDPNDLKLVVGSQAKQAVVQEYISKPLLIDKLKFDIRLYVLIKSLEPLEIYIAKEGLTRFCTEPYQEPSQKNLSHIFMHLTNYSLNVHSGNFVHSDSQNTGSKRTLSSVLYRLGAKGVDIKMVWSDIISLVIMTVIGLVPELKVYYQADIPPGKPGPTCFQVLGFDILLMKNLKPVLLEVNSNPSMRIEHEQEVAPGLFEYVPSPVDEEVKVWVIRDTLRLMDPFNKKTAQGSHLKPGGFEDAEAIPMDPESQSRSPDEMGNLPSLCLKQVYPKYNKQFNYLRLVERIAALFIRFLGVKGNMRLGPTAFRTFIRTCKLSSSSFSMASVDILYIDITRRWSCAVPESREADCTLLPTPAANWSSCTGACTRDLQRWHRQRTQGIHPEPASEVVVRKPKTGGKRCLHATLY
ncbi:tubulin polyglutamylase TTLL11 [Nematolebias whitei]|uniref:tubulin polyglutamylase TTLL11 n=1 Tax=Nematolebias whitei TaxID=451745 RepID=UPI00189A0247|nr:tubulin polyglutamylase TTLL11 [Nematolebias whitei]